MQITDIKVRKIVNEDKMKGVVSVTFDDAIAIHDIKIIDSDGRLFVAMPSRKSSDGIYRDIAHPINKAMRNTLQQAVLSAYQEEISREVSPFD